MRLTDPRAAGFDANAVRDAIGFAMQLGMPDNPTQRVKFIFEAKNNFTVEDPTGNPYEWSATPSAEEQAYREVEVPVAMEFVSRSSQARDTSVGFLLPSHADIYIMDTHIDEVRGADYLMIDGNRYTIMAWYPPIGLFDFTLYPLAVEATDES